MKPIKGREDRWCERIDSSPYMGTLLPPSVSEFREVEELSTEDVDDSVKNTQLQ